MTLDTDQIVTVATTGDRCGCAGGSVTQLPFSSHSDSIVRFGIDQMRAFADGWGIYLIGFSSGGSERRASPIKAELVDVLASMNASPPLDLPSWLSSVEFPQSNLNVG